MDGMPSGIEIDLDFINKKLRQRASLARIEADEVKILSGVFENKSLGSPIAFIIENKNQRSKDYEILKNRFRPSHADDTYAAKYGFRDHRGGGRASARETAARVVAGGFASLMLKKYIAELKVLPYTLRLGSVLAEPYVLSEASAQTEHAVRSKSSVSSELLAQSEPKFLDIENAYEYPLYCPNEEIAAKMQAEYDACKASGDTLGGVVECVIRNLPKGIGEPIYDKLSANLAKYMLSINAAVGFEYGLGFEAATMRGSQSLDEWAACGEGDSCGSAPAESPALANRCAPPLPSTKENRSGGIRGGISTGEDLRFRVAFKPIPSLAMPIGLYNAETSSVEEFQIGGRHDISPLPRVVPVVEAMANLCLADLVLQNKEIGK